MRQLFPQRSSWQAYVGCVVLLLSCLFLPGPIALGAEHDEAWATQIMALRLSDAGQYAAAEPLFKRAIQLEEAKAYRTWTYKLCVLRFVRNYIQQGQYVESLPLLDKLYLQYTASDQARGSNTTDRIYIGDCLNDAGEFLMVEHKYKDAEAVLGKALRVRQILQRSDIGNDRHDRYIDTAATESALGRDLLAQKRFSEAQVYLDHAAALLTQTSDPTDWLRCEIGDAQIKCLIAQKKSVPTNLSSNIYSFYNKTDFSTTSRWSIYLKSAERIIYQTRKSIDCWWHRKDTDALFGKALNEAESFGANDMRLAGTLLKFGSYKMLEHERRKGGPLLNRAVSIASSGGVERLTITTDYLQQMRTKEKYPSFTRMEDLDLLRNEIAAYKRIEGTRSKRAANLCRDYVRLVCSERGMADRWKMEQLNPMLNDIEQLLAITDPEALEAFSLCVEQLRFASRYYDAMVLQRKVVAGTKDVFGSKSHEAGLALQKYAELLFQTNDLANATTAAQEAEAILGHVPELDAIINPRIREPNPNARPR